MEPPIPWNLLTDHHGNKIDPKFIVKLTKKDEVISNEAKKNCKVLYVSSEWKFEDLLALFNGFNPQEYSNLFVVVIKGKYFDLHADWQTEEPPKKKTKTQCKNVEKILNSLNGFHHLIFQLTSKDENMSKVYYKEVNSGQFHNISQQEETVAEIKDFSSLLRSFLDSKIENVEQITAAWQNIIKSSISMKFLQLFENLFFKLILEVTKSGTKADLLTVLDAPAEHEGRVLNFEAQNYLFKVLYEKQPSNVPAEVNENDSDGSETENESQTSSSVLLTAIEHKKAEIIEYLITYWTHLIQELPVDHQLEISTAAFKSNQFDVLCDLLDVADFPFPDDYEFDDEQEHKRLRKITLKRMAFTNAIKRENFTKIDEFIDSHKSLKCVYSIDNETALTQAIDLKKFGVFYYLKSLRFQGEDCEEVFNKLDEEDRKKATQQAVKQRKANFNQALVNAHKSVMLLATRSLIHNRRISKEQEAEYRQKIMNWLQDIHKVAPEMLDVAASCEYLKIIFDFESHTVENASLARPNASGVAYPISKWIFVGGKLSDKKREQQIKGVLAHELCHYVMRLVYENQENPYYKDREDIKEMFERIVRAIDIWSTEEEEEEAEHQDDECNGTISSVFTLYETEDSHPELIVRAAKILNEFDDNEDKTRGLKQKYEDLFNFCHHQVIPQLQLFHQKNQQVEMLNRLIGFLPKILEHKIEVKTSKINEEVAGCKLAVITTNIPMLLFVNICGFLKSKDGNLMDSKNLFVEPEKLNNLEILNKFKQICRDDEELNIFVDCTKGVPECLGNIFIDMEMNFIFVVSSDVQREELTKIFVTKKMENATKMDINYNWNDLTEESQKSLLETEINFQKSSEIAIKELFVARAQLGSESLNAESDLLPDVSEVIDDELLNMIIDSKMVTINSVKEPDQNEKYFQFINFERSFIKNIRKIDVEVQKEEVIGHKIDIDTSSSLSNSLNSTDFVPEKKDDDDVSVRKEVESTRDNKIKNVMQEFKISQEKLLLEAKNQKFVLISDKAGNGKSWAMKNISKNLCELNPTKWVTYVDLKQFIKEFKAQMAQQVMPEISSFMAEKILKTQHKFESKIFQKLYKDGKNFIFFDGFDEIAPNCAEFVSKLAQSFQPNGGNQLWISKRDYFEVDLMKKLEIDVAYGLEEMTDYEGTGLKAKSWILMDLGDKKEDMLVEKFNQHVKSSSYYYKYEKKAEKIVKKVKMDSYRSVGMPQMFNMIADGFKDEHDIDNLTRSNIYEKFIKTLYRRWSREKGEIRKEASIESQNLEFNFWKFHFYQAILSLHLELAKIFFPKCSGKDWPVKNNDGFIIFWTEIENYVVSRYLLENAIQNHNHRFFQSEISRTNNFKCFEMLQENRLKNLQKASFIELIDAVKANNIKLVSHLLSCTIDVNIKDDSKMSAIDYAWINYRNFEKSHPKSSQISNKILLMLLNANSKFPSWRVEFDYEAASKEVRDFVDMCESLHRYLYNNDIEKIIQQISKYSHLRYFHDRSNESLMLLVLKMENIELLGKLNGEISIREGESLKEIYYEFVMIEDVESEVKLPPSHLMILMAKSRIINSKNYHICWNAISNAFKSLNEIDGCAKVLKIAAINRDLKIFFDFSNIDSKLVIHDLDNIYIGAKNLTDDDAKYEVIGVLAHELCHMAISMVYMNDFNPFPIGESSERKKFEELFIKIKEMFIEKRKIDSIIKNVFLYTSEKQYSELIVRPYQIVMHYLNNIVKMNHIQKTFSKLFDFMRDDVEPEFDKALPVLKKLYDKQKYIKFNELTDPLKAKLMNTNIIFQGYETTFSDLLGTDMELMNFLSSDDIKNILLSEKPLTVGRKLEISLPNWDMLINTIRNDKTYFDNNPNEMKEGSVFILSKNIETSGKKCIEYISAILKSVNKSCWVISFEQKDVRTDIWQNKNYFVNVEKFLLKILNLNSETEKDFFIHFYRNGKIIFLFDWFDEIARDYPELLIGVFQEIQKTSRNQLWIFAKPYFAEILKKNLNISSYEIVEYKKN